MTEAAQELIPDRLADIKPFRLLGMTWNCWLVANGQRYAWRPETAPLVVYRNTGKFTYTARCNGLVIGDNYVNARAAMIAAINAETFRKATAK